ncbi:MAG TPA: protein kinase [Gemmatimonadaceae bacterium]|jgi:serine/threonine-protein kinase|nr:protein kinase [Gemmatimonadaceae bacterium]
MATSLDRLRKAIASRYEIERELGHGAMATVYLAKDLKHNREVAVKVLLTDVGFALGPERFRREIDLASHLSHPHILPIYDSGEADGELYYVMPYVAGESLRARLNRERQLPLDEALRITCEVASALDHSHRHGIIHRDIKPENILLEDGQAMVADFGIARAVDSMGEGRLTSTGVSLGTPTYMSPEQGMADPSLDGRSDIYSLGCVLYEMLAGQPPFTGRTTQALIARHSLDQVPSLSVVRQSIPEDVEDAVLRALEKVPADRFGTAAEFAAALKACHGSGSATGRRTGRRTLGRRPQKRNQTLVAVALVFAILLVSGAAWAGRSFLGGAKQKTAPVAGGFRPQRVAVLYFTDLSPDKRLGYLADGLTESVINQLGQVSALEVISADGVKQFRGKEVSRDSVAGEFKAGTLVEGKVEQEGNQARVTVRLIEGNSGSERDNASVVGSLENPLALRTKVSERLALMLRQWLGDEIRFRELRAGTESPVAWSLVQRAEKFRKDADALDQRGDAAAASRQLLSADTLLAEAESIDPKWPEPIIARGKIALKQERMSNDPAEVTRAIDAGLAHANRALALDPRNADALELRGTLYTRPIANALVKEQSKVDDLMRNAERDLRAAIAINPTQAGALYVLSTVQSQKAEDPIEALLLARRAYEADAYLAAAPQILWGLYSSAYDLGQFQNAKAWCDEAKRRFPEQVVATRCQLWIMTTKAVRADPGEAWRRAADLEKSVPPQDREYRRHEGEIVVAAVLARAGLADSARRVLVRARADSKLDPTGQLIGYEAFVRALLGDKKEAIDILARYLTDHPEHRRGFAKANPWWWQDLQNEPRFKTLIAAQG